MTINGGNSTRSLEDEDLLERSIKKTKTMGCSMLEEQQAEEAMAESGTNLERKETQTGETTIIENDTPMMADGIRERMKADVIVGNQGKNVEKAPEIREPFGPWMLATKQTRRGRPQTLHYAKGFGNGKGERNNGKQKELLCSEHEIKTNSRFEVLGLEQTDIEEVQQQEEELRLETGPISRDPRLDKGKRAVVQVNEKQILNSPGFINRMGREAKNTSNTEKTVREIRTHSRQAAAQEEHIVVRGSNRNGEGSSVTVTRIGNEAPLLGLQEFAEGEHYGDPPDGHETAMEEDLPPPLTHGPAGLEETRELPDSMWVEILSRLPSKTLAWVRAFPKAEKDVLNFLPTPPEDVVILSSSNGLVCFKSRLASYEEKFYVCNPLTKECITLQWSNNPPIGTMASLRTALIFNPLASRRTALIFEPFKSQIDVSTDFQVVTIFQSLAFEDEFVGLRFSFRIYSSRTKEWTISRETCTCDSVLREVGFAVVEGVIYWRTYGQCIFMFNPETEQSFLFSKPDPNSSDTLETLLGEAAGKLQFLQLYEDRGLQVWELEDSSSSDWSVKHSISLEEIEKENPCLEGVLPTNEITLLSFKDMTLLMIVTTGVYAFNIDTKKAKLLCPSSELTHKRGRELFVIPYTMSLVPLG
nr:F-box protein At5g49610-like [Ipomoea batatas]